MSNGTYVHLKAVFYPKVDTLTILTIEGCTPQPIQLGSVCFSLSSASSYASTGPTDLDVYLEMGTGIVAHYSAVDRRLNFIGNNTIQSTRRRYINAGYIIGAWSAYAQMNDGYPTSNGSHHVSDF